MIGFRNSPPTHSLTKISALPGSGIHGSLGTLAAIEMFVTSQPLNLMRTFPHRHPAATSIVAVRRNHVTNRVTVMPSFG